MTLSGTEAQDQVQNWMTESNWNSLNLNYSQPNVPAKMVAWTISNATFSLITWTLNTCCSSQTIAPIRLFLVQKTVKLTSIRNSKKVNSFKWPNEPLSCNQVCSGPGQRCKENSKDLKISRVDSQNTITLPSVGTSIIPSRSRDVDFKKSYLCWKERDNNSKQWCLWCAAKKRLGKIW